MLLHRLNGSNFADSFKEMDLIQKQLNRLLSMDGYSRVGEFPPINVWTSGDNCMLTAEIPGLESEDLEISVVNETLTLRGSRKPEALQEGETYHRREREFGEFSRSLQLPFRIDSEQVQAKFKNGVLTISLPRAENDKPRKISVRNE